MASGVLQVKINRTRIQLELECDYCWLDVAAALRAFGKSTVFLKKVIFL